MTAWLDEVQARLDRAQGQMVGNFYCQACWRSVKDIPRLLAIARAVEAWNKLAGTSVPVFDILAACQRGEGPEVKK